MAKKSTTTVSQELVTAPIWAIFAFGSTNCRVNTALNPKAAKLSPEHTELTEYMAEFGYKSDLAGSSGLIRVSPVSAMPPNKIFASPQDLIDQGLKDRQDLMDYWWGIAEDKEKSESVREHAKTHYESLVSLYCDESGDLRVPDVKSAYWVTNGNTRIQATSYALDLQKLDPDTYGSTDLHEVPIDVVSYKTFEERYDDQMRQNTDDLIGRTVHSPIDKLAQAVQLVENGVLTLRDDSDNKKFRERFGATGHNVFHTMKLDKSYPGLKIVDRILASSSVAASSDNWSTVAPERLLNFAAKHFPRLNAGRNKTGVAAWNDNKRHKVKITEVIIENGEQKIVNRKTPYTRDEVDQYLHDLIYKPVSDKPLSKAEMENVARELSNPDYRSLLEAASTGDKDAIHALDEASCPLCAQVKEALDRLSDDETSISMLGELITEICGYGAAAIADLHKNVVK